MVELLATKDLPVGILSFVLASAAIVLKIRFVPVNTGPAAPLIAHCPFTVLDPAVGRALVRPTTVVTPFWLATSLFLLS